MGHLGPTEGTRRSDPEVSSPPAGPRETSRGGVASTRPLLLRGVYADGRHLCIMPRSVDEADGDREDGYGRAMRDRLMAVRKCRRALMQGDCTVCGRSVTTPSTSTGSRQALPSRWAPFTGAPFGYTRVTARPIAATQRLRTPLRNHPDHAGTRPRFEDSVRR